jgi:hyperosmotically inducible protein
VIAKHRIPKLILTCAVGMAIGLIGGCEQKQAQAPADKTVQASVEKPPASKPPASPAAEAPPAGDTSTTRSLGTAIDDSGITMRVKSAFVADPDVKSLDITVEARKGEVQLSGFVDTQAQIDRAVDIAKRTEGVTGVQNKLALKTPGTVGAKVDDALITAKVKTAFIRDDSIKALDIAVNTNNGEVQLSGFVANEAQASRAAEVARAVEGVKSVDNKMSVKR